MLIGRQCRLVFLGLAVAALLQAANPFANDPQAREAGRLVFRIYCSPCHGVTGEGGPRGPDLTSGNYSIGKSDDALFKAIHDGIPGTAMAGFGGRVVDENIWRTVVYVQSFSRDSSVVQGDKAKGAELFWGKGGCGQCHAIGAKGGHTGPNLSRVGKLRGATYIRKAILNPNPEAPGYSILHVTTRDGRKFSGTPRGSDNFTVRLIDSEGNFRSLPKEDLTSITEERKSAMPAIYGRLFTPAELDDLIAYLVSLIG